MTFDHLILLLIGLSAGMLGGLLGIGGSVLMIPALSIIFGPAQHLYQGAAMIVNAFTALSAVVQHRRAKAILGPVVRVMIPAAAASVIAGVAISNGPWFRGTNEVYLSRLFGGFLLYAAAYNIYRLFSRQRLPDMSHTEAASISAWKTAALVGAPMGLASGLLGLGGGVLAVPLQQLFLRIPLRRAIANSSATIMLVSLIGAAYKNYANAQAGIPFSKTMLLAFLLIPSAMIGGYLGASLTHVLPRRTLRLVVALLMGYGGTAMVRRPVQADPPPPARATVHATGVQGKANDPAHVGTATTA